jgi:hypothetical protein
MEANLTKLYNHAFACWQRANKQNHPELQALWEGVAQRYLAAALSVVESEMVAAKRRGSSASQPLGRPATAIARGQLGGTETPAAPSGGGNRDGSSDVVTTVQPARTLMVPG